MTTQILNALTILSTVATAFAGYTPVQGVLEAGGRGGASTPAWQQQARRDTRVLLTPKTPSLNA
jgi:hypothetical protein